MSFFNSKVKEAVSNLLPIVDGRFWVASNTVLFMQCEVRHFWTKVLREVALRGEQSGE
jgi:hypothetical protein